MKFRLSFKIFLISLSVTIVCFASVTILFWISNDRFMGYIQQKEMARIEYLAETLVDFYKKNIGWGSLVGNLDLWNALMKTGWTEDEYILETRKEYSPIYDTPTIIVTYQRSNLPIPIWDPLNLGPRICLFDEHKEYIIGVNKIPIEECSLLPIELDKENIGWLGLGKGEKFFQPLEQAFRKDQTLIFLIMGGGFLFLLSLIVFLFSKHMLIPINRLVEASKALTKLNFKIRIPVKSSDEIGELINCFNEMAQKLEDYEKNQNQWLSDISHELRTPLSALLCEIELLQDGIRKADNESLVSLAHETKHLIRLVNDLRDLSLAETGELPMKKKLIKPLPILSQKINIFQKLFKSNDLSIVVDLEPAAADIQIIGDPDRLIQLFSNIFENAINHTEKPGVMKIKQGHNRDNIRFIFEDSGPGVPDEALPYLFNRLYRLDRSRSRTTGGSGLGLAICKSIVEMHKGKIRAQNVQGGGLMIEILLPIEPSPVILGRSI